MSAIASISLLGSLFEAHRVWIVLPSGFWGWILIGLIAGWLAGKIARGRGFGCIADIILGIVGSFIGGWIFVQLKIYGGGFLYSLAAATVGAVVLVFIAHLFSPGDR
ncbi:MAG: GlsB/YeaQ/YmgE family stress response membrane protein [Candidatus Acidiferrum sp.]